MFQYAPVPDLNLNMPVEDTDNGRFYTLPNGKIVPSVTTVLGYSSKEHIENWRQQIGTEKADRISNRAKDKGNNLHSLLEAYLRNEENVGKGAMPNILSGFYSIKKILNKIEHIYYVEQQLYSTSLQVAGRCDVICKILGDNFIIDFKTSNKEKKEEWIQNYFEQATAYAIMVEEMVGIQVPKIMILIAQENGELQVFIKDKSEYIGSLKEKVHKYYNDHNLTW